MTKQPTNNSPEIEHEMAMFSLTRPGNILLDVYLRNRENPDAITYLHPHLKKHLQKTFGVMIYHEQLMDIIKDLSGLSAEDADQIRRSLGKKDKYVIDFWFEKFSVRCLNNPSFIHECNRKPDDIINDLWKYFYENAIYQIWGRYVTYALNNQEKVISRKTIDNVFEAAKIEEVISQFIELKNEGDKLTAVCPFHKGGTTSLNIRVDENRYHCSICNKSGNPVNFIMEFMEVRYPDALIYLADKYDIEIEFLDMESKIAHTIQPEPDTIARLNTKLEFIKIYKTKLLINNLPEEALYLRGREKQLLIEIENLKNQKSAPL